PKSRANSTQESKPDQEARFFKNKYTMKLNLSKFQGLRIIYAQRSKPNPPNANSKSTGTYCVNLPKFVRRTEVAKSAKTLPSTNHVRLLPIPRVPSPLSYWSITSSHGLGINTFSSEFKPDSCDGKAQGCCFTPPRGGNRREKLKSTAKINSGPNLLLSLAISAVSVKKPNETFNEAWERIKDLLRQCPHHGFSELHQLDTFYNALNPNDQDALDSAPGGNFLDKIPRECLSIIESKSKVRYSRSRITDVRANTNAPLSSSCPSNSFDLQQIAASLEDKLDIRIREISQ
nr:reverse transcriptase domain-containing protein [Tanacetum cinerariifolium]